jgi:cell division protease FtsH
MAQALMQYETIDADQIEDIMNGKPPRPPRDWGNDGTSGGSATGDKKEADVRDADKPIGGPANTH